jgi:hypothetical protein
MSDVKRVREILRNNRLLLEIQTLRALQAWQTIENAPKLGTPILVFATGDDAWRVGEASCHMGHFWEWADGFEMSSAPTHWMPLPLGPETTL